jgi:putative membrane protein
VTIDTGTGLATPVAVQPEWRRLSRRMLLVHPVLETLRAIPFLLGALLAGQSSGGNGELWGLLGVAVTVSLGILRWATTSYRVGADQVQVRRGFFRRRVVSIPRDRVRTVDITATPLHRLLGLIRLTVGTGQSDRKEGLRLDGLTAAAGDRLRVELLHRGAPGATEADARTARAATAAAVGPLGEPAGELSTPAAAVAATREPVETMLARMRPRWVGYGPFTLSGLVTIGVVVAFLYRLANEAHVNPERFGALQRISHQLSRVPLGVAIGEVALTVLVLVAVLSTVGYVVAFWAFRLSRQDTGTLHVTRGLLTTRATTIEERRLRGVELSEPLLLRAVRGARCIAIATGLRVGRGAERGGSLLLPPAPRDEAVRVAAAVLGDPVPMTIDLTRHGHRATRRRYIRALTVAAVLPAGLAVLWWLAGLPAWVALLGLLALPVGGALAADRARNLGHAITPGHLVVRQGSVVRRRSTLARDGIIGWRLHQSIFQRRAGLITVIATTAAGHQHYALLDVPVADAVPIVARATPGLLTPFLA